MHDDLLGLSLPPGAAHYRAYVGPPGDYDLVSAMTFGLLAACGLRQHHKVLDVGCGSLRLGRLLIPYLNAGRYVGLEPNKWLIDDGLRYEVGDSLAEIRRPEFIYDTSLASLPAGTLFDYAVAQSIFSHTAPDLLKRWIGDISSCLSASGILLATVIVGASDCSGEGWVYPECVEYRLETIAATAAREGLEFQVLDWFHPRQTWCALYRWGFDAALLNGGKPSWNHYGASSHR
jgi:SAM-dependent methyltransferase